VNLGYEKYIEISPEFFKNLNDDHTTEPQWEGH
jgi:hypothetical protein